ncbi:MAG: class C sortase [Ruminococcaceae bacterium]|jgi:sortase A|nr:class C sortase [Oscillospiraceae bacterium]
MRKRKSNIFLILILIVGLSLLLYPPVSNWWNSYRQSKVVSDYAENVSHLDNEEYQRILNDARAYNEAVAAYGGGAMTLSDEQRADYLRQLDVDGSGIMGYIDIQKIRCTLPIYHGTDDGVLQIAIGHIEGSSLPVGGESTHCVLSGHRGLPSARLFTDIDQLVEGDTFLIRTLDEVLTYEVDQIRIVLPREVGDLCVEPGKDLCTLVTCTPYGVNTHRLLVRGHRVDTKPGTLAITAEAFQIRPVVVMPAIAIPLLLLLLIAALIWSGRRSPQRIMNEHRKAREEKQHK